MARKNREKKIAGVTIWFVSFSKRQRLIIFVIGFAIIGSVILLISHAASPTVSIEPESGTKNGNVSNCSDGGASGGACVQFGVTTTGVNFAKPFAANSLWNTPTPTSTNWYDSSAIHSSPGGQWWNTTVAIDDNRGTVTDPIWTFNMPNYIGEKPPEANGTDTWNRRRSATTIQLHAPATLTQGIDSDKVLLVTDTTTGQYIELWNAVIDQTTHTVTSGNAAQTNLASWATGNAITNLGMTSLVMGNTGGTGNPAGVVGPTGLGSNDGVRASNFSVLGGLLTKEDFDAGAINHALVWALNPSQLKNGLPYPYRYPATSGDAGGNTGPIIMGSKIGIPPDAWLQANGLWTQWQAALAQLNVTYDGKQVGLMLAHQLQTYGIFVGDATSSFTQFYSDGLDLPPGGPSGYQTKAWSPLTDPTHNWYGASTPAMVVLAPFLRVADYQP